MAILDLGRRGAHSVQNTRWDVDEYDGFMSTTHEEATYSTSVTSPSETLVFLGAGGGCGKSTIALLAAFLCAQQGLKTTLIEADVTFGDYQLWLGLDSKTPSLDICMSGSVQINENLVLYKAPSVPRVPENMLDPVIAAFEEAQLSSQVVIVDTATTWNELTARLVAAADHYLIVMDQRPSTIVSAIKAAELALASGVPSVRASAVYNRWNNKLKINCDSVRKALGCEAVYALPDGRDDIEFYLSNSSVMELLASGNVLIGAVGNMLSEVLGVGAMGSLRVLDVGVVGG